VPTFKSRGFAGALQRSAGAAKKKSADRLRLMAVEPALERSARYFVGASRSGA
jgi:hypothetical protein